MDFHTKFTRILQTHKFTWAPISLSGLDYFVCPEHDPIYHTQGWQPVHWTGTKHEYHVLKTSIKHAEQDDLIFLKWHQCNSEESHRCRWQDKHWRTQSYCLKVMLAPFQPRSVQKLSRQQSKLNTTPYLVYMFIKLKKQLCLSQERERWKHSWGYLHRKVKTNYTPLPWLLPGNNTLHDGRRRGIPPVWLKKLKILRHSPAIAPNINSCLQVRIGQVQMRCDPGLSEDACRGSSDSSQPLY